MSAGIKLWLGIACALIFMIFIVISRLLLNRHNRQRQNAGNHDNNAPGPEVSGGKNRRRGYGAANYLRLRQFVRLDKPTRERLEKNFDIVWVENHHTRQLHSRFKIKRAEAAAFLGLIGTKSARLSLEKALLAEQDNTVRLYIANALADIADGESLPVLVGSLINSNRFYREKVNMMIAGFGKAFDAYLPEIIGSKLIEMKELIVAFACEYYSEQIKTYLMALVSSRESEMKRLHAFFGKYKGRVCANCVHCKRLPEGSAQCVYHGQVAYSFRCRHHKLLPVSIDSEGNYNKLVIKACDVLAAYFPRELDSEKYLESDDILIKNVAVRSLAAKGSPEMILRLIPYLKSDDTARSAVHALSRIAEDNPGFIHLVAEAFHRSDDAKTRQGLSAVLAGKAEYYIMKLRTGAKEEAGQIISEILSSGRSSEVIGFLNHKNDAVIEDELVSIIKTVILEQPELEKNYAKYLRPRVAAKCGLTYTQEPAPTKVYRRDKKLIAFLCGLLALSVLLFPAIYVFRRWDILHTLSFAQQLKIYILDINYYIAYFTIMISFIYLGLLGFSFLSAKKQVRLWRAKSISLLFKKNVMPSVSIIAPACNEEMTIIDSANSLLNLKYPDYELIIVNDGSQDNTLEALVRHFDLTRVDYMVDHKLKTKPVRGIYINRQMPKLIVVDKENGGKADSLNAGINIAGKEYFCGIDADSLLEADALLKLASLTLDTGTETPALGGNIFPVNGCTVEQGQIKDIRIPDKLLSRLQTVEYTRAFMSGRLGWAYLNSLLIISGAFGLFRKERVVSIGGYLTSSGEYERDTVGENMELIVRISRFMNELKQSYKICYSFNANCWTQVPEDLKSLKKQRYRWHRGLVEILTFHRKMLFNPRYGRTGMIAIPYYFIFELMGPLIEVQGYLMVILALILGLMNAQLALLLFVATVLMGILISVSSLVIEESDADRFSLKDLLTLILYAVMENFGPKQLISFWRVSGFMNMLKKPGGWDKAVRKSFGSGSAAKKNKRP